MKVVHRVTFLLLIAIAGTWTSGCATCVERGYREPTKLLSGTVDLTNIENVMRSKGYEVRRRRNDGNILLGTPGKPIYVPARDALAIVCPRPPKNLEQSMIVLEFDGSQYYRRVGGRAHCKTSNRSMKRPVLKAIAEMPITNVQKNELRQILRITTDRSPWNPFPAF